jgi:membrane-bound metal-dependent hydrolase YbcI (DUF457 family)
VYIEHLIYSAALAVIVGMIFSRLKGSDPSWIIIAVAFVPDIDLGLQELSVIPGITLPFMVRHGDFHNILALIFFSVVIAAAASTARMWFSDAFVCAVIGIAAHFFEDALIADPAYRFFWPFSLQRYGIGIFTETPDVLGIANSEVLLFGFILLSVALCIRTLVEGKGWWKVFLQGGMRKVRLRRFVG